MIFKTILKAFWRYFDVICFVFALVCINFGAFLIFNKIVWITSGLSLALIGWFS
ncbi:phage head-tail adapter protein, partial [Oenococcus oeni]